MTDTRKSPSEGNPGDVESNQSFDKEALPDKIGSSLRTMYDSVLTEDVPDDFLNLLKAADEKGASGRAAK